MCRPQNWRDIRRLLEQEKLAGCLRGRVRYGSIKGSGLAGSDIYEILLDGKLLKRFSLESANDYFVANGLKKPFYNDPEDYINGIKDCIASIPPSRRTEFSDDEFTSAVKIYIDSEADSVFYNADADPILSMFLILDSRFDRASLLEAKDSYAYAPEWLRTLYDLRLSLQKK